MPGISATFSCDTLSLRKIESSYRELQYDERIKVVKSVQANVATGFSAYEGYPLHTFDNENASVLLEGLVYDKSDQEIDDFLGKIADEYCQGKPYRERIAEFVENSDGDYIILIHFKKSGAIILFNDRWGRLPAFFFAENRLFAFSREIKFLLHWISRIRFDQIAMAEFLIYQYNLGEKTLVKGIKRLSPASLLEAKSLGDRICVTEETLLPVSFETVDLHLTKSEIVGQCIRLFQGSLVVRAKKTMEKGLQIIADLSGGHDTRVVFGGLCQIGVPFTPCTDDTLSVRARTRDESLIARQLADSYGKMLCRFSASHPVQDFSRLRSITYLTDCAVNGLTAVVSYHDSLERMKSFASPTAHFMGFGGEFIRCPYRLKRHYPNIVAMLEDGVYHIWVPPRMALAITKLEPEHFRKSLQREVDRLPEREDSDKLKHLYFEFFRKLVNGGEDRHRRFSWTVQPLLGKNLLTFEMTNIPVETISYSFFIDFLRTLDPKLLEIPFYGDPNFRLGSRVGVFLHIAKMQMEETLANDRYVLKLYLWAIRRFRRSTKGGPLVDEIRRICQDPFVSLQFDGRAVEGFLLRSHSDIEAYQLLTLMSYIAEVGRRFGQKVDCNE